VTVPGGDVEVAGNQKFAAGPIIGPIAGTGPSTVAGEAMAVLWRAHSGALLQFALRLTLGDWHRAEDIVQETLLRAWRHPEVIGTGQGPVRPWLLAVTRNIAVDMWRSRMRAEAAEVIVDGRPTCPPDPEWAATALDVRAAVARLGPGHRQVIFEMYFLDRSISETAEILGTAPGTVKSRRHYSLRELRRIMTQWR
jgi:RNA polymerase sigma-70 factor (ECF subfamily)